MMADKKEQYIRLEDAVKIFDAIAEKFKSTGSGGGSSIPEPPNDGSVYAWSGGEWVRICPEGYNVQVSNSAAASALSLPANAKVLTSNEEKNG